jgi:hypothetical protein
MVHTNPYLKYYQGQVGGGADFPVFVGGQHGEGLGDFFRSVLRFIAPIALRGLSAFTSTTLRAHEGGATLKDAARSAIGPSLGAMATAVSSSLGKKQEGSGMNALFAGDEGVPYDGARVYNGDSRKRKHHYAPSVKTKRIKKRKQSHGHSEPGYNF